MVYEKEHAPYVHCSTIHDSQDMGEKRLVAAEGTERREGMDCKFGVSSCKSSHLE